MLGFFSKKRKTPHSYLNRSFHTERIDRGETAQKQKKMKMEPKPVLSQLKFNSVDYVTLCRDKFNRFQLNSSYIGNAVLHYNGNAVSADQYAMPVACKDAAPVWVPLQNIHQIKRFWVTAYRAEAEDGTKLYSNRGYRFIDEHHDVHEIRPFFSFAHPQYTEPFWGSSKQLPITNYPLDSVGYSIRGGQEIEVDCYSVMARIKCKERPISQTNVMEYSAFEAYQNFYDKYRSMLASESKHVFNTILHAKHQDPTVNRFYPEWHHAVGYHLAPLEMEPQKQSNLGGGPQWSNTMMMILETLCQWHACQNQDVAVRIKPTFFMLFASDLIEKIHYEAFLGYRGRHLTFKQIIEPLRQHQPVIPQPSDIAQITGITQAVLSDGSPFRSSKVDNMDLDSIKSFLPVDVQEHSFKF